MECNKLKIIVVSLGRGRKKIPKINLTDLKDPEVIPKIKIKPRKKPKPKILITPRRKKPKVTVRKRPIMNVRPRVTVRPRRR